MGGLVNVKMTTQYMPCVPAYLTVAWKSTNGMSFIYPSLKKVNKNIIIIHFSTILKNGQNKKVYQYVCIINYIFLLY